MTNLSERRLEKVARELAHRGQHKNEGLWEMYLVEAYEIVFDDPGGGSDLCKAYDARHKTKAPRRQGASGA